MADYVSILGRAVDSLSENSPLHREQVYLKARTAIDRKLRAMEPPLSEEAVASQLASLEAAISEVEAIQAAADTQAPTPDGAKDMAGSENAETLIAGTDQDTVAPSKTDMAPVSPGAAPEKPVETPAPVLTSEPVEAPTISAASQKPDADVSSSVTPAAAPSSIPTVEAVATRTNAASQTGNPVGVGERKDPAFISELADDPVNTRSQVTAPVNAPVARPSERPMGQPMERPLAGSDVRSAERPVRPAVAPRMEPGMAQPGRGNPATADPRVAQRAEPIAPLRTRKSPLGRILATLGILGILGAGAAGAYVYREDVARIGAPLVSAIEGLIGSGTSEMAEQQSSEPIAEPEKPADSAEPTKDATRLDSSGESTAGEPINIIPDKPAPEPVIEQPVASEQPSATVEVAEPAQTDQPAAASEQQAGTVTEQPATDQTAAGQTTAPVAVLAGEKAFLYEEAVGATGASRDEGSITWSLANESPEPGAPAEPVIKGMLEVPGRGLALNLSIKRNVDPALSASHVIELLFVAPPEFSGGNIDELSRFVMKSTEQARGESLVGVPARIDTGYFLIALNNLPQAQQTNLNLLLNSSWIDIPVTYVTGRRALITFDKGASGTEIFKQALDDWKNR
jgi:hypothetical protein